MGLHRNKSISEDEMNILSNSIKTAEEAHDLKRLQCVYLRGLDFSIETIAAITQFSLGHIKRVWSLYYKGGVEALKVKPRGGRHRCNLSLEEEKKLLARYMQTGENGTMLEIAPLYKGLCERTGRKVGLASAYRLAQRHGWRKIAPRPEHTGRNPKAAQYFKIFFSETD
jgi:transposase